MKSIKQAPVLHAHSSRALSGEQDASTQGSEESQTLREEITSILLVPRQRKIGLGYGKKVTGWHPFKQGHPPIPYESTLERDFLSRNGGMNCVEQVIAQPVTIYFKHGGQRVRYTPDFWVRLSRIPPAFEALGVNSLRFFVEVKPTAKLEACQDMLAIKFAALRRATGLSTILFTEMEIRVRAEEVFGE